MHEAESNAAAHGAEAQQALEAAGNAGDTRAQVKLAEFEMAAGRPERALTWAQRAVEAEDSYACALLGAWDVLDLLPASDPGRGLERLSSACDRGEATAAAFLAYVHAVGLHASQSWDRALDHLVMAAKAGNDRALTQLALLLGGDAEYAARVNLYWAAATRGFPVAQFLLGAELLRSDDAAHRRTGVGWIGTAALGGDPYARSLVDDEGPVARWTAPASLDAVNWTDLRGRLQLEPLLAPPAPVVVSSAPAIATIERLIPHSVCAYVVGVMTSTSQRQRRQNTQGQAGNRTTVVPTNSDVVLELINNRMAMALGVAPETQELTTIVVRRPGERPVPRVDYIDPAFGPNAPQLARRGQRVATALLYLNDRFDGGVTQFPQLPWGFRGPTGSAVIFRNIGDDGAPERRLRYMDLPPDIGEKWVLEKRFRDRRQAGAVDLASLIEDGIRLT